MEIDGIFAVVAKSLVAVKYEDIEVDEFERLFDDWTDVRYLLDFFTEHTDDLTAGFYGDITIDEAIEYTLKDAARLEQQLIEIATLGQTEQDENLQTLFKPLNNAEYRLRDLQKSKAYGVRRQSWLRVYAIRIAKNIYVVSGGAIKLTPDMQREHLRFELYKLELTKQYLIDEGLFDEYDFEYLQLE